MTLMFTLFFYSRDLFVRVMMFGESMDANK